MLSSVLKDPQATPAKIEMMRAFGGSRQILGSNAKPVWNLNALEKWDDPQFKSMFSAPQRMTLNSGRNFIFFLVVVIYISGFPPFQVKASSVELPRPSSAGAVALKPTSQDVAREDPSRCGSAEACFNFGIEAERNGKREEAKAYFEAILERHADAYPWVQRAGYLLGKWEVESHSANAQSVLLRIQNSYPEMGDYVMKLLADHAFNQSDFSKAAEAYAHLLIIYPDTALRPLVLIQRGDSLLRLRDYDRAIQTYAAFCRENPKDEKVPEVLDKLLEIHLATKNWDRAAKTFREIQWKFPDTPQSRDADGKLSQALLQPAEREKFKLSPQEKFNKGKNLLEIGKFVKALDTWKEINRKRYVREPFWSEMELKTGFALLPLKRYAEARSHFKSLLKRAPDSEFAQDALLALMRIAVREENESDLRKFQKMGKRLFPHQETYYKILYLLANYDEEHHQAARGRAFYQAIIKELPQSSVAPDALWKQGWLAYKEGDYTAADQSLSKLLDQYPSSVLQVQALYWEGRNEEKLGQIDAAQGDFKKLCQSFAHSYYCHLAKKRIIMTGEDPDPPSSSPDPPLVNGSDSSQQLPKPYQKDDHYLKAKELMKMNLAVEASKEFTLLADHYSQSKFAQLQIDRELIQAGDFYHALKNIRSQFPDVLDRGKTYDLPLLWELAYPREILTEIVNTVKEIKIEPEFVAGVMREESVFDVKATSKSGAMGLMQLMPFTGEWVAQQLGFVSFAREKLYDQDLNIWFGAYYLDHLNQRFRGNLVYTAASYNAGPEAVDKWILNGDYTDLEEFVENIPYRETRYYVKRVIKSYEEFKDITRSK